jgi:hypothetical protein
MLQFCSVVYSFSTGTLSSRRFLRLLDAVNIDPAKNNFMKERESNSKRFIQYKCFVLFLVTAWGTN